MIHDDDPARTCRLHPVLSLSTATVEPVRTKTADRVPTFGARAGDLGPWLARPKDMAVCADQAGSEIQSAPHPR